MPITETPKVRYFESESNPTLTGDGAQIPLFIGVSGNTNPANGIQKFKNFTSCYKTVENGGIGTNLESNPLLSTINEFFQEADKSKSDDIGVPYVYVIDLGSAGTETAKKWTDAMALAKSKREVQAEVYCGFKKADTAAHITSIMESAIESINIDSESGNPRIAYYTVNGVTDEELIAFTDDSKDDYIQNPRVGLIEPKYFGKTVAKICTTPYYEEPGYTDFRSILPGEFGDRTPEEETTLQNAGIMFIRDEIAGSEIHPRINLAVSSAFATNPDSRSNDSLIHARRNVDNLVRKVYDTLYSQLKRNETETNISFLQSDIDVIVEEEMSKGYMMKGTQLKVVESETNPFDLKVEGVAVPVNSTILIGFSLYVESPNTISGGK